MPLCVQDSWVALTAEFVTRNGDHEPCRMLESNSALRAWGGSSVVLIGRPRVENANETRARDEHEHVEAIAGTVSRQVRQTWQAALGSGMHEASSVQSCCPSAWQ